MIARRVPLSAALVLVAALVVWPGGSSIAAEAVRDHVLRLLATAMDGGKAPVPGVQNPPLCREILEDLRQGRDIAIAEPTLVATDLAAVAAIGPMASCHALDLRETRFPWRPAGPLVHDGGADQYAVFEEPALDHSPSNWYVLVGSRPYSSAGTRFVFRYVKVIDPDDCWIVRTALDELAIGPATAAQLAFMFRRGHDDFIGRVMTTPNAKTGGASQMLEFTAQSEPALRQTCQFTWTSAAQ